MSIPRPPRNFGVVTPQLYRGGLPIGLNVAWLKVQHVQRLIDLTRRERPTERRACERYEIEYFKMPLDEEAPDQTVIHEVVGLLSSSTTSTYLHCWGGRHRTGIIIALLRMQNGWQREQAIAEMLQYGFGKLERHAKLLNILHETHYLRRD